MYQDYMEVNYKEYIISDVLYSFFILATTLWCIVLIIYYIITVVQGGTFFSHNSVILGYFDYLAGITKGIAPTLLVGHVAAGYACPDESWQRSVISGSLHFGTHFGDQSSQQDSMISINLESQQEIDDVYDHQNPASSEEDSAYDSGIQEDDLEVTPQEREKDKGYSYCMLKGSKEDIGIESVISET
ncbi:uncharacterized protein BT62DRAFT_923458 [Guyanagaster necrorhizus]|uniref:Uncharacterized protein n=1 Tax=Guyanagaster necrorhizus TaxID=856835 RepID=A0A9P7VIM8_9AGAR|nr:uncharacterized protein BT62DRAFT_923458 [Guyanagaster necrorhizus MCA 3950]KAG7441235.1 hypothetical protein BT62DRAFT_923458 [Guyanagaster necrorhizus MCA 3950]